MMGDGRTRPYVLAPSAVQTSDFMSTDWAEPPYAAQKGVGPHHQRSARHQPRDVRREQQAASDDRVGMTRTVLRG